MTKREEFDKRAEELANRFAAKTPDGRANQLANVQGPSGPPNPCRPGHLRSAKHGGFSYLRTGIVPGCHICIFGDECEGFTEGSKECSLILSMQDDLIRNLMALEQLKDEDILLVEELARVKTFLWITDKWLSRVGPFKDKPLKLGKLEPQGILDKRSKASNTLIKLCDQLGLSPLSRAKLKLEGKGFDFAKAMMEAEGE